ncbi:RNase A-like domain-containing protein [Gluconobacter aidae]|uniref:Bacterial CdiA-CT RNAse A domain-containing protein n=1 Tax=Gluconobacter aidae TaxID=2662454 RepID=A0A7X1VNP4_9PROT|nr:RNase A-like domain-containing protein [Gluconobacter aidae]MQR98187.1 hypothetical protein [Gluconobacter aidae]
MTVPSNLPDPEYRRLFPQLASYGAGPFGEDVDTFGDTLMDVIQDVTETRTFLTRAAAIRELETLLACNETDLARITWALIAFDPLARFNEPAPFPSLSHFWTALLRNLETGPPPWPDTARRQLGGCVMERHIAPTEADIKARFADEKLRSVSFFQTKENAEHAILQTLQSNADAIDAWLAETPDGMRESFEQDFPEGVGIVITEQDRRPTPGKTLSVTLTKRELRGMAYYIETIRIYA